MASTTPPYRHLHVGDFGKDLDDEVAALVAAHLVREGLIDLRGTVANLDPAIDRARLAKGTYRAVGLDVAVAAGTSCDWDDTDSDPYQFAAPYLADVGDVTRSGDELFLTEANNAPDHSLHLVLMSGFTDAAEWLHSHPALFTKKVASVTMMSGVIAAESPLRPDRTANNDFDYPSTTWLYAGLHEHAIPTTVVTRNAAYAAAVPRSFYDALADTGHPVARRFADAQHRSMEQFWQQCNLPKHHPDRRLAWGPDNNPRTADWFLRTFCDGHGHGLGAADNVWPHIQRFAQYDALTVLAACPEMFERFFTAAMVDANGSPHSVVGPTPAKSGVKDPDDVVAFLTEAVAASLAHHG